MNHVVFALRELGRIGKLMTKLGPFSDFVNVSESHNLSRTEREGRRGKGEGREQKGGGEGKGREEKRISKVSSINIGCRWSFSRHA